jgi:hypothetical protein
VPSGTLGAIIASPTLSTPALALTLATRSSEKLGERGPTVSTQELETPPPASIPSIRTRRSVPCCCQVARAPSPSSNADRSRLPPATASSTSQPMLLPNWPSPFGAARSTSTAGRRRFTSRNRNGERTVSRLPSE